MTKFGWSIRGLKVETWRNKMTPGGMCWTATRPGIAVKIYKAYFVCSREFPRVSN